jgi:hypothetical protein
MHVASDAMTVQLLYNIEVFLKITRAKVYPEYKIEKGRTKWSWD